jgi:two-component system response regulator FixJ
MTGRTVYIVDDTEEVRTSLVFLLQGQGYACRAFTDGSEFLTELLGLDPGCVLLDFQMPGFTGLEVLSELRWIEVEWPVVMMTGQGDAALALKAMGHGAFDFLEKPFEEETLTRILDQAFSSGRVGAGTSAGGDQTKTRLSER